MFSNLLVHPTTQFSLEALATRPPHALLLLGPTNIGKATLAKAWAQEILKSPVAIQTIEPDEKGSISIERIRNLYHTARTKQAHHQFVIIDQAETMSLEAENAFLKLLEEPRLGLTFILTADRSESLLPTVLSRVQQVSVQPVSDASLRAYILQTASSDIPQLAQLLFIAKGRPGKLMQLLGNNDTQAKAFANMQQAKSLLTATPYERYQAINAMASDRQTCLNTLEAMERMVSLQIQKNSESAQLRRWITLGNALEDTLQHIVHNGNVKAQLLQLFSSY